MFQDDRGPAGKPTAGVHGGLEEDGYTAGQGTRQRCAHCTEVLVHNYGPFHNCQS